jgi:hypothetical protein
MTSLDGVSLLIVLRMDMPNSLLELLVIIALSDCGFLVDRLVIVFVHYQEVDHSLLMYSKGVSSHRNSFSFIIQIIPVSSMVLAYNFS